MKHDIKTVDLIPVVIDAIEIEEKVGIIADIMYEYFCQLQISNPTANLDAAEPFIKRESA